MKHHHAAEHCWGYTQKSLCRWHQWWDRPQHADPPSSAREEGEASLFGIQRDCPRRWRQGSGRHLHLACGILSALWGLMGVSLRFGRLTWSTILFRGYLLAFCFSVGGLFPFLPQFSLAFLRTKDFFRDSHHSGGNSIRSCELMRTIFAKVIDQNNLIEKATWRAIKYTEE